MNPRTFIIAAAVAGLIVAGFLLNTTVHATTPAGGTVACGSVWEPSDSDGKKKSDFADASNGLNALAGTGRYEVNQYRGYEAACSDAVDSRGTWGWVLAGIALVALLGAVLIRRTATP